MSVPHKEVSLMYIDLVYRASLRKPLKQLTKKKNTKDDYGQWPNLMVAQLLLKKPKWKYLYQSCCTLWQVAIMGCLLSSCIFLSAFVICPGFSDVHQSRHPCQATVHVDSVACKMKLVWLAGWVGAITSPKQPVCGEETHMLTFCWFLIFWCGLV